MAKGWTYVCFSSRPYAAQITIKGRTVRLGMFDTPEEAHQAYVKAREENPRLPKSGGQKNGFQHARKICDICGYDWAVTKFDIHRNACERKHNKDVNT